MWSSVIDVRTSALVLQLLLLRTVLTAWSPGRWITKLAAIEDDLAHLIRAIVTGIPSFILSLALNTLFTCCVSCVVSFEGYHFVFTCGFV